jgi:sugar phosphate isomerase/epimerase
METVLNRRSFLRKSSALLAAAAADSAWAAKTLPVGVGLYAVEDEWNKDPQGTLRALSKMGFQLVELWGPYFDLTAAKAKEIRKMLDDTGLRCLSTHNDGPPFTAAGLPKAIELNHILGSKDLVVAGNRNDMVPKVGGAAGLEGWKRMADHLAMVSGKLKPEGLRAGYHNHPIEFTPIDGKRPMDIIAANTPKEVMLQLCVGACMGAHADPVEFMKANPGRIRHIHCKDWSPEKEYSVRFGEGAVPWSKVFATAESVGGVEFYLIEQLGNGMRSLATVQTCMNTWKKMRAI